MSCLIWRRVLRHPHPHPHPGLLRGGAAGRGGGGDDDAGRGGGGEDVDVGSGGGGDDDAASASLDEITVSVGTMMDVSVEINRAPRAGETSRDATGDTLLS